MKTKIILSLVPLVALSFMMGCGDEEKVSRTCLDPEGNVVDTKVCEDMYAKHGQVNGHVPWFYYWYYIRGGGYYPVGGRVVVVPGRGSFTAPSEAEFGHGSSVGVVRGGFGGSGISAGE